MSDDYHIRLLPFILRFSHDFFAFRGVDKVGNALLLDAIFRRFTGVSCLDGTGVRSKGGVSYSSHSSSELSAL